ncbi:MAG TPA: SOS response-associated peptidase [Acidimicrobiia bacterium]|nr:SOS response-associated peptidase [Acidimicrobiia bacterium]
MCGRYVSVSSPARLAEVLHVDEVRADDAEPDYNVTPRAEVPVVAETKDHRRVLDRVRWGLVPSWAKDVSVGDRLINARADTVATKPAYRRAFERRRCLMPADGFYEWRAVPGQKVKQPYFIARADREPMVFAGLYEVWRDRSDPDAEWMRTCALITTDANEKLAPIHDRMPVVLPEDAWGEWLDPENRDTESLHDLLVPAPSDEFIAYPISRLVNKPENQGPELLEPVDESESSEADDAQPRLL